MGDAESQTMTVDWDKITDEILCPLCEYNLRLLPAPRCPECGYRFEWHDLLNPSRRHHPYLFEHHPERKIWSFFKTLVGGFRPGRFWTSLYPSQRSRLKLLVLYWAIVHTWVLALFGASVGCCFYLVSNTIQQQDAALRARLISQYNSNPTWASDPTSKSGARFKDRAAFNRWLGTVQTSRQELLATTLRSLVNPFHAGWRFRDRIIAAPAMALGMLLWPWLTFLALMVFRISMRRARVKAVHVLRCVVYSGDIALLAGAAALAATLPWMGSILLSTGAVRCGLIDTVLAWIGTVYVAIFFYRLAIAYRRYLKFDWPAATVLASQIVVGLLLYTALARLDIWL